MKYATQSQCKKKIITDIYIYNRYINIIYTTDIYIIYITDTSSYIWRKKPSRKILPKIKYLQRDTEAKRIEQRGAKTVHLTHIFPPFQHVLSERLRLSA